jgi:hypothetical protein
MVIFDGSVRIIILSQPRLTPQQVQEIMTRQTGMLDSLINGWISGPGAAVEAALMGEPAANTHELYLLRLPSVLVIAERQNDQMIHRA